MGWDSLAELSGVAGALKYPEKLEVWEQEVLACSGVSSGECPLEVLAVLVPWAAPRCSCGCQRRWVAAACLSGALELAEKEVLVGFQGCQSPSSAAGGFSA